jgi:U3 small nucleolar ribonucleoprotein protein IMP4
MSVRRQIRLRKEFLYKKHAEVKDAIIEDKKRKLQSAVDSHTAIPTEIAQDARQLYHEIEMDVPANKKQVIDDEYAKVGLYEPRVCVTTSRDPSSRLKQFAKEIKLCIPNAQAVNRGSHRTDELIDSCRKADFTDVIILSETRGMPDGLIISHLPFGPSVYFTLSNCVLRHDIPECTPASQAYPHLILESLNSRVGDRVGRILQALYPIPKEDTKRVITFANNNDFLSFRHHMYTKEKGKVTLQEAGPRFEMLPYEIRLGTADNKDAEKEWVLRPFMNTARKKQSL